MILLHILYVTELPASCTRIYMSNSHLLLPELSSSKDKFVRGQGYEDLSLKTGNLSFQNIQNIHIDDKKLPHIKHFAHTTYEGNEVLASSEKAQKKETRPDLCTLLAALNACSKSKNLPGGMIIHADAIKNGYYQNIVVANAMIHMYANCGSRSDVCLVFDRMVHHDIVSWNRVISYCVQIGECNLALDLFAQMQDNGFTPNARTYVAALKSCTISAAKEEGKQVRGKLVKIGCLEKGIAICSQLAKGNYELDRFVATTMVDMFAKCGSMLNACMVFERMLYHNVYSWNALVSGYFESGEYQLVLQIFSHMQDEGYAPNARTYIFALKSCANCAAKKDKNLLVKMEWLEKGISIHSQLVNSGCELDMFVGSTLLDIYAKCGSMAHACQVFHMMPYHDVVSWNAIIFGYIEGGKCQLALHVFTQMQDEDVVPDARTYVAALKACSIHAARDASKLMKNKFTKMNCLEMGIALHSQIAKSGYELVIFVANTLVDMYVKCGNMTHARWMFDRMPYHDMVSWCALISGYAENHESKLALQLFEYIQDEGYVPNARTYVAVLKIYANYAAQEDGRQVEGKLVKVDCLEKGIAIHSQLGKKGHELDIFIASVLVDLYAKCGSMIHARHVFNRIPYHDVVLWNVMIFGYAEGESELALDLFSWMQYEGFTPDVQTYVAALKACAVCATKEEGKHIKGKLVKVECLEKGIEIYARLSKAGHKLDNFVANTLVDMYAKCGSMVHAHQVFDKMPSRDVVSWSTMIFGYTECGEGSLALQFFAQMQDEGFTPTFVTYIAALKACASCAAKEGVEREVVKIKYLEKGKTVHSQLGANGYGLDIFVASTLVDMYAKCGSIVHARWVFDRIPCHNVVSWNALIFGYIDSGDYGLALEIFVQMKDETFTPNSRTYVAALKACGFLGALETGKVIHDQVFNAGLQNDLVVANSLVGFYGKCGNMVDAEKVFNSIRTRDLVAWNTLLAGYAHQGDAGKVFGLFRGLQEEAQADEITFLTILTACSHSGLVEKGKEFFQAMHLHYLISPNTEHYACMVDLLCRANCLDAAVAMVGNMPFYSNLTIWKTLLGACWKWKNVVVGRLAFESILRLDDQDASAYALMANIYMDSGLQTESRPNMALPCKPCL